jgi:membrane associated rhomboid family serine protease
MIIISAARNGSIMQYYNRYTSHPVGSFFHGGVVKKLIIANVAVFILQLILIRTSFDVYFALYPRLVIERGFVWQLVTYMFLHGGIFHLAINMFIIWMFGTPLERLWGSSRFLKFYFVCGLGGAVFSFIFAYNTGVIGASGAGYGILLAYAVLFPYNEIYVWGIFPMKARTLVIIIAAVEFVSGISGGTGIAHFAHLGGMAAGLLYTRADYRARRLWQGLRNLLDKVPIKVTFKEEKKPDDGGDSSRNIDSIRDKISSKGYENLSETEKRILENYSENDTKH